MKRIRYCVAMSLDGYIAGPSGGFDWIVMDPDIEFDSIYQQFDTILVGRRSFEVMVQDGPGKPLFNMATYVCSRTLNPEEHPDVTILGADALDRIAELRDGSGSDIWLFGGGELFRSLLDANLVDAVEVAVIPVLLGEGIPLLPPGDRSAKLQLVEHRVYPKTGTVGLDYRVEG